MKAIHFGFILLFFLGACNDHKSGESVNIKSDTQQSPAKEKTVTSNTPDAPPVDLVNNYLQLKNALADDKSEDAEHESKKYLPSEARCFCHDCGLFSLMEIPGSV